MEFILISGIPRAKAIPFADATPILNPVNEPGPEQTATALSSWNSILRDLKVSWISECSFSLCTYFSLVISLEGIDFIIPSNDDATKYID